MASTKIKLSIFFFLESVIIEKQELVELPPIYTQSFESQQNYYLSGTNNAQLQLGLRQSYSVNYDGYQYPVPSLPVVVSLPLPIPEQVPFLATAGVLSGGHGGAGGISGIDGADMVDPNTLKSCVGK